MVQCSRDEGPCRAAQPLSPEPEQALDRNLRVHRTLLVPSLILPVRVNDSDSPGVCATAGPRHFRRARVRHPSQPATTAASELCPAALLLGYLWY